MSDDSTSSGVAADAGVGNSNRDAAAPSQMGDSGTQAKGQSTQIPSQSNNGGSNNDSGASSGVGNPGQAGEGRSVENDEKPKKRQRRPPTAAQTAARKKAAEERKRFRDRVNLIAAALEEEQGRNVQESSSSTQQSTSNETTESSSPTETARGSHNDTGGQEFDQGGDYSDGDEMDLASDVIEAPRAASKRDIYFGNRIRRTRGLHRVAGGFQQFLSGSAAGGNDEDGGGVRLPSATAMRQQFNWARAPGTSLLDRMAVMNNRATAHANMRRSVRLPKYMDGL